MDSGWFSLGAASYPVGNAVFGGIVLFGGLFGHPLTSPAGDILGEIGREGHFGFAFGGFWRSLGRGGSVVENVLKFLELVNFIVG